MYDKNLSRQIHTLLFLFILIFTGSLITCRNTSMTGQDSIIRNVSDVEKSAAVIRMNYENDQGLSYGILDVTKSPYEADPTGESDATTALQQALKDARDTRSVCYLPAGRYLVSGTIEGIQGIVNWDEWPYGDPLITNPYLSEASFEYPNVIMGTRGKDRATIVLADHAPGFGDPDSPRPVIYFWARAHRAVEVEDLNRPAPSISFNQKIMNLDFDLGAGNPGAIAIDHRAAEGSTVEDVYIRAYGAFAGIRNAPGSGGSMHGIRVEGGRYGLYVSGSQPSPLVSDLELTGQTEYAVWFNARGPLTLVGARIRGAGIRGVMPDHNYDGALNLVDVCIELENHTKAVQAARSIVMDNVWIRDADTLAEVVNEAVLAGDPGGIVHVRFYAAGARADYDEFIDNKPWKDALWVDREKQEDPVALTEKAGEIPAGLTDIHRYRVLPDFFDPDVVNVRQEPYLARGDGLSDDTEALQRAIDASEKVFLPKGTYLLTRPLKLRAGTVLFGVSNILSVITTFNQKPDRLHDSDIPYHNTTYPDPLIETADDPEAATMAGMFRIVQPALNPCVYALHWRAGRKSVVQNVYVHQSPWHSAASMKAFPLIKVSGSGGGRWYNVDNFDYWCHGPDYRFFLAEGTRQPLRIYHLQPQFNNSEAMVEFRGSEKVDVYSSKCEGDNSLLWITRCRNVRFFGLNGLIVPSPGREIIRITESEDILITHIHPYIKAQGTVHWGDFISFHAKECFLLRDGDFSIGGTEQFSLYRTGDPEPF